MGGGAVIAMRGGREPHPQTTHLCADHELGGMLMEPFMWFADDVASLGCESGRFLFL